MLLSSFANFKEKWLSTHGTTVPLGQTHRFIISRCLSVGNLFAAFTLTFNFSVLVFRM